MVVPGLNEIQDLKAIRNITTTIGGYWRICRTIVICYKTTPVGPT